MNESRVAITRTQVNATGFRSGLFPNNPPNPGVGIQFDNLSEGLIGDTTVTMSFGTGIKNNSSAVSLVRTRTCNVFDNRPDIEGKFNPEP